MIKVNFRDGTTLAFDLNDKDDVRQWEDWVLAPDFQKKITGVGILHNKKFYAVPVPKNFSSTRISVGLLFSAKDGEQRKMAEKIDCVSDNIKTSITVYTYSQPPPPIMLRVDVVKLSKRNWDKDKLFPS